MTKQQNRPTVVAITSDHHVGSTIGLCPYRVELDDGGEYRASRAQRWLWRNWLDYCARVKATAEQYKAPIISIFNGDITDGNHHRTTQSITGNETTQMRLAYDVIKPLVELSEQVYIVRGTEVHVGGSGRLEEKVADDLTNVVRQSDERASWWQLYLDINGTTLDACHHGKLGRLPWTKANGAHNVAGQVIIRYAETGHKPPSLIIRSHLHQYADTGQNFASTRLVATPAWQLATAFIHRIAPGALADIGGLIVTCWPGGRYEIEPVRYRPKRTPALKVRL